MRIVSLLPSATDIVCTLGLEDHLVGRTHECDWPPSVESVPVITSDTLETHRMRSREIHNSIGEAVHSGSAVYALDVEALDRAQPDLVLTQELCEVCAVSYTEVLQAARAMDTGTKVVSLEPRGIDDILAHVELVGSLTGTEERARAVVEDARSRLQRLREATSGRRNPRVVCIEWLDPMFAAGHWVPEQVEVAGGRELCGISGEPSRRIEWDAVIAAAPEVVVLMPCGMSIERTVSEVDAVTSRPGFAVLPAARDGSIWVVDASSYFNRPGPRIVRGAEILHAIFHRDGEGLSGGEARRLHT